MLISQPAAGPAAAVAGPAAAAVGLIGLGEIGQVHAAAIRRSPVAHLAAVADTAAELLQPFAAQGLPAYADADELIADPRVGTVSVCLPHDLHFPVALRALKAGKNVLVEKPLAIDPGQCQQLIDAAQASGVKLGVSHNQVFYAAHVEAKRLIDSGAIGRPVLIRLRLGMGPMYGGWRDSPAQTGGGLLIEAGVHRIYLARYLFGPVRDVHAVLDMPRDEGEQFAVAVLQFESGVLGVIEANYHGPPGTFDDEIEIVGTGAILRLGGIESLYVGFRGGPALTMFRDRQWSEVPVPDDDWRSSVETSVIAYLDAVTAGREPPVTGAAGLETVRLIHRIYDKATILNARAPHLRAH
jgi:predicted dehydrogenase